MLRCDIAPVGLKRCDIAPVGLKRCDMAGDGGSRIPFAAPPPSARTRVIQGTRFRDMSDFQTAWFCNICDRTGVVLHWFAQTLRCDVAPVGLKRCDMAGDGGERVPLAAAPPPARTRVIQEAWFRDTSDFNRRGFAISVFESAWLD